MTRFLQENDRAPGDFACFSSELRLLPIRNRSLQVLTIRVATVRSGSPQHWLGRLAGVVLALVAGLSLLPSRARASCGDYLRPMPPAAAHQAQDADPQPRPHDLPASPDHKQPCSGPNCSRGSNGLPFAPAPSVSRTAEQWGAMESPPDGPAADAKFHAPGRLCCDPIHRCFPLEHPPRLDTSNLR